MSCSCTVYPRDPFLQVAVPGRAAYKYLDEGAKGAAEPQDAHGLQGAAVAPGSHGAAAAAPGLNGAAAAATAAAPGLHGAAAAAPAAPVLEQNGATPVQHGAVPPAAPLATSAAGAWAPAMSSGNWAARGSAHVASPGRSPPVVGAPRLTLTERDRDLGLDLLAVCKAPVEGAPASN